MNKRFNIFYIFLLILFPACNSGAEKEEIKPLLSLTYSDEQDENNKLEFTQQNTVHFLNAKPYINEAPDYMLSKPEIAKRDSFIQLMTGDDRRESYVNMENDYEHHHYAIKINRAQTTKEIFIIGDQAPKKFYHFISWAITLKRNP